MRSCVILEAGRGGTNISSSCFSFCFSFPLGNGAQDLDWTPPSIYKGRSQNKKPIVAKFTPWDLYPDKGRGPGFGYGYSLDQLKEKWAPLTTIFLYRRNMVEHFLSFLAYHKTGIGNATSQYMHYQRPKAVYDNDWIDYHKIHFGVMEKCYWEHKFDHTVTYEELFDMDELCGVPLKDYHGQFTFKLNKYTREEKDEVIRRTGYSENYEIH